MDLVDKIHEQMFITKKSKISIQLPSYIKADDFMEYVNDFSSSFRYTIENGVVTCELNPEKALDELLAKGCCSSLEESWKHIPKVDECGELDEAGRKFMAEYYVDNPGEFNLLLQNMANYKAEKFEKAYESIKSTEVLGKQGGGSDVFEFGYYCQ